jgi:hypothetical protein
MVYKIYLCGLCQFQFGGIWYFEINKLMIYICELFIVKKLINYGMKKLFVVLCQFQFGGFWYFVSRNTEACPAANDVDCIP